MGVLPCSREGCENIMCDRHSYVHGYICWECFNELVALGPEASIPDFMQSVKREDRSQAALARFDVEFPMR